MLKPSANIIHTPHMNQYSLVIAVAKREPHSLPHDLEPRVVESGLTFLGLFGPGRLPWKLNRTACG